jgi:translation initiation factor IF-2
MVANKKTVESKKAAKKSDQIPDSTVQNEKSANKEIHIKPPVIVKNLAEALDKKPTEIIKKLMGYNILASINQTVDTKIAEKLCKEFGVSLIVEKREKTVHQKSVKEEEQSTTDSVIEDNPEDLIEKPPVVTFLGHVDHGKTSIQDAIRKTNIVGGESRGITQHTGASVVEFEGKKITFIDTPGHEAFTAMRARGANVTDLAVLVVAADDGFMPQTVEAMNHAKAAGVPIIVAINKMDLPTADSGKVLLHMQQNNLMSEEWGGEVGTVQVSATTGQGLNELLERILLEAEILELKANPKRPAEGIVIEAELEPGRGATANILVKNGTLRQGDIVLCDQYYGRVKAIIDESGARVNSIGPSMPGKILGLSGVPSAGAKFVVCKTEKEASDTARKRGETIRSEGLTRTASASLEDLFSSLTEKKRNDLNMVLKTDVQGTSEAIIDSLKKLPSEKIKVNIIHSAVGAVSESDILLASASNAIVVGFHAKVNPGVNDIAKSEGVEIRLYSIIYELIEDITDALEGRLAPDAREIQLGKAKIQKIFNINKGPKICGCLVEEGTIKTGAKARVFRAKDKELIYNGSIQSLRRFQDDVKEVKSGQECGIRLDNFLDFQEDDIIEVYEVEFKKAKLA